MAGTNGEGRPELPSVERWLQIWTHRELLKKVARRRGARDAEDVAQEAMLRAAQHPEIPSDKLLPWLIVVTGRLCVDGHRRRAKETSSWTRVLGRFNAQQAGQHPEDDVCERAAAAWVAAVAADALPARQIRALQLTAAGYDVRQVAIELGVPYRAAESLLARARRALRAALSTGLGVLGWLCRAPVDSVGSPAQVGLAAAVVVLVVPVSLPALLQPLTPPVPPTAAEPATAEPTAERSPPHHDRLPPLVEMGAGDEHVDRLVLDGLLRREVLLEGAVHEVDPADHRLAEHTAAIQQVLQHVLGGILDVGHPLHGAPHQRQHLVAGQLRAAC